MHVCIVCCQHLPDDVRVTHKIAMAFRANGCRVTWVGPERPVRGDSYGVDFRFYPAKPGRLARLLRFRDAFRVARTVRDVDAFYAPEPDSAVVAEALGRLQQVPSIFDIHEVYHAEMLHRWAEGVMREVASLAVKSAMRGICAGADLVVAVSDPVMEPYKATRSRKLIVRNCAPLSFADGGAAAVFPGGRPLTIMHGKTTVSHGTRTVLHAMSMAQRTLGRVNGLFFDTFATQSDGYDRDAFLAEIERLGLVEGVALQGLIPMQEVAAVLRRCDVGVIAYNRTWGVNSLPNKLFEYMGAGLPIIAPIYSLEVARIVESERCGLLVDTEDPVAVANAIVNLGQDPDAARAMGRRGRDAFLARHNWQAEFAPLLDFVRDQFGGIRAAT